MSGESCWFVQVAPPSVVARTKPRWSLVPTAKQSRADGHDTPEMGDMDGGADDWTVHGAGVVALAVPGATTAPAGPRRAIATATAILASCCLIGPSSVHGHALVHDEPTAPGPGRP